MAINKVIYGNETLIDITDTTATVGDVASGKTFYQKDGTKGTGSYVVKSDWKKLGEAEYTVSTSSTTNTLLGTINCSSEVYTKSKIIYVKVRDEAGRRTGYFLSSDTFFINTHAGNDKTTEFDSGIRYTIKGTSNPYSSTTSTADGYGVYGRTIKSNGDVEIYVKYQSSFSGTIDGTYKVEVYSLEYPDGKSPFEI